MSTDHGVDSRSLLNRTPLYDLHAEHGGRFVPFAGYELPVQYPLGVLTEHLHTRQAASLFDVSHMGQILVRPKSGHMEDAARAIEALVPGDIVGLASGRQRYTLLTNPAGGIIDDLMIANCGDHFLLIVNAACKSEDFNHLQYHLSDCCELEHLDRALIALQGPRAEAALLPLMPDVAQMRFMDVRTMSFNGSSTIVSRSGYTGEDGFEISIDSNHVLALARSLLAQPDVALAGLGARDSLRLEAGLCLYGTDIDGTTTPIEANLNWTIPASRRAGGKRQGGFPGADVILAQMQNGTSRLRCGFQPEGRMPVRNGAQIYASEQADDAIGHVTSGGFSPSLNRPIAMGYVATDCTQPGSTVFAEVRGQRIAMTVTAMPFVPHTFKK